MTPRATTAAAAAACPAKHRRIGGQAGNDEWRRPGGVRSSPSTTQCLMGEATRGGGRQIKYPATKRRAGARNDEWGRPGGVRSSPSPTRRLTDPNNVGGPQYRIGLGDTNTKFPRGSYLIAPADPNHLINRDWIGKTIRSRYTVLGDISIRSPINTDPGIVSVTSLI
ncbi:hypothetical protein PGTUg99_011659 [Puccinia graminis f. sp. tritici]|uniref:Uncharacterized protein n=1 Tax=Puccinia graminis f. sp. tritici TaxID=56615 RepID=A0A5B0S4V2_PUCGR|nr:hypothetical protein PGTUg99_011659 [Puccinia graminis f. sp. tritici]